MNEYTERMSQSFQNELDKIAMYKVAKGGGNWILPAAAGGLLTHMALQAERDRRIGRRYRVQSGG
jgi:hypothetical protein